MARTTINSLGIPADTIVSADLDYPLTDFSSTGIDDNATGTALTIDSSGNISVTGTVDGRDLATDGAKLDNIEESADVTDTANVTAAGALMDSELTDLAGVKGVTISTLQPKPSEGAFANGDKTKLDGIAASATNYGDSDVATYISGNRSYGNITTTGYIAGPSTFTIDPAAVGDNTGTLVIAGNLQVDGTTTTINSTTMTVDDLNITLASGAANAAAANGAGITVDGASATLTYNGTNDVWSFNKSVGIGTDDPNTYSLGVGRIVTSYSNSGNLYGLFTAVGSGTGGGEIDFGNQTVRHAAIASLNGSDLSFYTNPNDSGASVTKRMTIDSSGNVGIGTNDPTTIGGDGGRILNLYNTSHASFSVQAVDGINDRNATVEILSSGNGGSVSKLIYGDTDTTPGTASPLAIIQRSAGTSTERMRIDSDGNVGIGTIGLVDDSLSLLADYNLSFSESTNSSYANIFRQASSAATVLASGYRRSETSNKMDSSIAVSWGKSAVWAGYQSIRFYVDAASADAVGTDLTPTERMRIDSSGNVGIGTDSPYDSAWGVNSRQLAISGPDYGVLHLIDTGGPTRYSIGSGDGKLYLAWDDVASAHRIVVDSAGKVGINTTSPMAPFVVSSTSNERNIEMGYSAGSAANYIQAYDRNASSFTELEIYSGSINFHTGSSASERMSIDSNGKVGIGISSSLDGELQIEQLKLIQHFQVELGHR